MESTLSGPIGPLVLLVEDNARNARLVEQILRANGYQVAWVTDGWAALEAAHSMQPQLILMDLQLPGMDGLTITRKLKEDASTAAVPVIAVTAHAMREHRTQLLAAGCCSYISKPISYRPFLDEIKRVLDRQGDAVRRHESHRPAPWYPRLEQAVVALREAETEEVVNASH